MGMKRRDFITLLGGAAATWSLATRAQQPERMRKIGALMNFAANDEEGKARVVAFAQALQKLGWTEGRNLRTDTRWAAADDADHYRRYSEELVALAPDVILASASPSVAALQRITRSIPIVFAYVIDPVGAGYVTSMARPGANITGFTSFEYSLSGKWLELLKEIAPNLSRVAVLRRCGTAYRTFTRSDTIPRMGVSPLMGLIRSSISNSPLLTSIASLEGRNQRPSRCRRPPSTNL